MIFDIQSGVGVVDALLLVLWWYVIGLLLRQFRFKSTEIIQYQYDGVCVCVCCARNNSKNARASFRRFISCIGLCAFVSVRINERVKSRAWFERLGNYLCDNVI